MEFLAAIRLSWRRWQFVELFAIEDRLGADTHSFDLGPLDDVVPANRKLVISRHAELTNLIRAWCAKNGVQQPFVQSRGARLLQQDQSGQPRPGTRGAGGGNASAWSNQLSDTTRAAMGMASEWLVWKLLFQRHPKEMSDECWVSTNREKFCTGPNGNDSLGYDFRVVTARYEYLYEVKSALDAGGEFELTAREIEVAGSAREDKKRRYRILYVPFVFDPSRWKVMTLPNPVGTVTRDQFRVVRSGSVRYRFDQR